MTVAALIVAAGRGTRAGGPLPKQWQPLAGKRVIDWTLDAFMAAANITQITTVLHPEDIGLLDLPNMLIVKGGETRAQSVQNGLEAIAKTTATHVLIHDAARCCVSVQLIENMATLLLNEDTKALAPALPVTDALWCGEADVVTGTQDRIGLYRAQTPQGFSLNLILEAHRQSQHIDAADDVAVARAAGHLVRIIAGDENNLKITHPSDFARAEKILGKQMDIRVGSGYDVHRFCDGDHIVLCGVRIPHTRALKGHSDADVGLHAITDAIYGALAEGDIGRHFPPSEPEWKGAESHIFLRHAAELAQEKGFRINNIDVTLVCEYPKVAPHAPAMINTVAEITSMDVSRVSVKATTSERLGFTGREEGIAAQAVVTLVPSCD